MLQIMYADGTTPVELGDVVSARLWLRRRSGKVIYIPGVSRRVGSFEHNGLTWVGVAFLGGTVIGSLVDPATGRLQASVRLLGRSVPDEVRSAALLERIECDDPDEPEPSEAASLPPSQPPRLIDWIGGIVSLLLFAILWVGGITAVALGLRFVWRLTR